MNLLVDKLPRELTVNEQEYPIDSGFRSCLSIIMAFEDSELTEQEKYFILLTNLFIEIPEDTKSAMEVGLTFLNGPTPP